MKNKIYFPRISRKNPKNFFLNKYFFTLFAFLVIFFFKNTPFLVLQKTLIEKKSKKKKSIFTDGCTFNALKFSHLSVSFFILSLKKDLRQLNKKKKYKFFEEKSGNLKSYSFGLILFGIIFRSFSVSFLEINSLALILIFLQIFFGSFFVVLFKDLFENFLLLKNFFLLLFIFEILEKFFQKKTIIHKINFFFHFMVENLKNPLIFYYFYFYFFIKH